MRCPYPMAADSEAAVKSFCTLLRSGPAAIRPWAIRPAVLLSGSGGSGSPPWSCHPSKLRWTERSAVTEVVRAVAEAAAVTAAEGMVAAPLAVAVVDCGGSGRMPPAGGGCLSVAPSGCNVCGGVVGRLGDASLVALASMMAAPKAVVVPTR